MKWREPWSESLKAQAPFRPFGRRVLRSFLVWSLVLAAVVGISALGKDIAPHDMASRLWVVPVGAATMSLLLYAVWWLSPRKIDSGPRGIVVVKADELLLIPWAAIASYKVSTTVIPGSLHIAVGSGDEYTLVLPHDAPVKEIEAEILEMTRVQT